MTMFPFLNQGCARKVYAINDDIVIKIAKYLQGDSAKCVAKWGIEQCKTELDTYLHYGDKLPLCKIYVDMCTEQRIVMERVMPLTDLPDDDETFSELNHAIIRFERQDETPEYMATLPEVIQRFFKKILESGLTRDVISNILGDVEYSNVGLKDGELVILDYGIV